MHTVGNPLLWTSFAVIMSIMIAVNVLMQDRAGDKSPSMKQAALWSIVWITLTLVFNALFWAYLRYTQSMTEADNQALAFLTGYMLEKILAADNVFVWLMIFNYFSIPISLQRRLLTWGILGAIGLRTVMVFAGSWLICQLQWLLYVFGAFLLFTGIKMAIPGNNKHNIGNRPLVRWLYRYLRVTNELQGERFFIHQKGVLYATPIFLALIMIECSDIVFSLDSIPAIFSVTRDPFIVLTSNLFAILGLRAMHALFANVAEYCSFLKYGLAAILVFIGFKMLMADIIHFPATVSLTVVAITLIMTLLINVWLTRRHRRIGVSSQ